MIIPQLEQSFLAVKNSAIAEKQAAYMRNNFVFLGLPKPTRAGIQKAIFKEHRLQNSDALRETILALWGKQEREFHLAAMDLALLHKKLWRPDFLNLFEYMIRTHSWWDTVDTIACNMVGPLVKKYPELMPTMDAWIGDEYMWTRRSALLFQMRWKHETDEKILYAYCKKVAHEKEFFIRKAIGWILREYSKSNAQSVKVFVDEHKHILSPLSVREGSKYLTKAR